MGTAPTIVELGDRLAIIELLHRYARGVDTVDPVSTAACFTVDGVWEMDGREPVVGRDELVELFDDKTGIRTSETGLESIDIWTHAMANVLIELDGDRATVESLVTAYVGGPRDGVVVLLVRSVRYFDDMVKQDGEWLIARRRHSFHWMFETTPTKVGEAQMFVGPIV